MRRIRREYVALALTFTLTITLAPAFAYAHVPLLETVSFESERWQWNAREHHLETHLGRTSLRLKGGIGWIQDVGVSDGVIEFDVSFTGERGFVGAIWRLQDARNYEEFYVRPHQSGKPDATQYTPVFDGMAGWQLYHGPGFGGAVVLPSDEWIHVRIVFADSRGEVYVGDMQQPVVTIHQLKRDVAAGPVGIMAGNFAPAWFSNFSFGPARASMLTGRFEDPPAAPSGTFMEWQVSSTFPEEQLAGKTTLAAAEREGLTWTRLTAEPNGTVNLARAGGVDSDRQTRFARVVLNVDTSQTVRLSFGYSDRVRVYLADRLLYSGDNGYRTRDFRYLGTIGLFDALYLPLEPGNNELWLAVSESFGGWGVVARIDNAPGVSVRADP